jgi:hypothetical protein
MNEQIMTLMNKKKIDRWLAHIVASQWEPIWEDKESKDEKLIEQVKIFFFQQRFQQSRSRI